MSTTHHIGRTLLGVYFVHLGRGEKMGEAARVLHCRTMEMVDEDEAALRARWPGATPGITPCSPKCSCSCNARPA